jgi:hypothetical protein
MGMNWHLSWHTNRTEPGFHLGKEDQEWCSEYEAEVMIADAEEPEFVNLEIKDVANGESFYINLSDIIALMNSTPYGVTLGPGADR